MDKKNSARVWVANLALALCASVPAAALAGVAFRGQRLQAPGFCCQKKPAPPFGHKPPSNTLPRQKPRVEITPRSHDFRPSPLPRAMHEEQEKAQLHQVESSSAERTRLADLVASRYSSWPDIVLVSAKVKNFGTQFQAGFDDPHDTLQREAARHPEIESRIQSWRDSPQEKRIFMTGARSDQGFVDAIRKGFEADGNVVFFYQDCAPAGHLCSEQAVGALFATSGQVVSVNTPESRQSDYTNLEIRIIDSRVHRNSMLILNAEPLKASLKVVSQAGALAAMPDMAGREIAIADAATPSPEENADGTRWPIDGAIGGALGLAIAGGFYARRRNTGQAGVVPSAA